MYFYFQRLGDSFEFRPLDVSSEGLLTIAQLAEGSQRLFANYPGEAYGGIVCDLREATFPLLTSFAELDQTLPPLWLIACISTSTQSADALAREAQAFIHICDKLAIHTCLAVVANVSLEGVESTKAHIRSLPYAQIGPGRPKIYVHVVLPICELTQEQLEVTRYLSLYRPDLAEAPIPLCGTIHWAKIRSIGCGSPGVSASESDPQMFLHSICLRAVEYDECPMKSRVEADAIRCGTPSSLFPFSCYISYGGLDSFILSRVSNDQWPESMGSCFFQREKNAVLEADADYAVPSMECQDS